ncbi:MAG: ribonuclease T2 [Proteobacteria bacterium]|nr:ribonuclease T2 [Pseudomonadota bacterium]
MKKTLVVTIILGLSCLFSGQAMAEIRLDGYFIARDTCEAVHSFRNYSNPGAIRLTVDSAYELLAKNKAEASHYRIRVKNASPSERWVSVDCGIALTDCREQGVVVTPVPPVDPDEPPTPVQGPSYLLAMSWQPAFCQTHQQKIECQTQTVDRYDASHFTLHGLWPQPQNNIYCSVSNNQKRLDERKMWDQLPALAITEETYGNLIETMPGVASYLHRHEWIKHGTCYSTTPEEYFKESIMLADQLNTSVLRDYFVANIGKNVEVSEIRAKFDEAFGEGASSKLKVHCADGMISELWINLTGEVENHTPLSSLLENAEQAAAGCQNGIIDPVGF